MHWQEILEIFSIDCDETYRTVGYVVIWLESREKVHVGTFTSYKAAERYIQKEWDRLHNEWCNGVEDAARIHR